MTDVPEFETTTLSIRGAEWVIRVSREAAEDFFLDAPLTAKEFRDWVDLNAVTFAEIAADKIARDPLPIRPILIGTADVDEVRQKFAGR